MPKGEVPIFELRHSSFFRHSSFVIRPCVHVAYPISMTPSAPLIDTFGRVHTNLRISVTDRCNIRCFYCMPAENVIFMDKAELLTFEELERFVRVAVPLGLRQIRLTGGEPLVRRNLHVLVRKLAAVEGIEDI